MPKAQGPRCSLSAQLSTCEALAAIADLTSEDNTKIQLLTRSRDPLAKYVRVRQGQADPASCDRLVSQWI